MFWALSLFHLLLCCWLWSLPASSCSTDFAEMPMPSRTPPSTISERDSLLCALLSFSLTALLFFKLFIFDYERFRLPLLITRPFSFLKFLTRYLVRLFWANPLTWTCMFHFLFPLFKSCSRGGAPSQRVCIQIWVKIPATIKNGIILSSRWTKLVVLQSLFPFLWLFLSCWGWLAAVDSPPATLPPWASAAPPNTLMQALLQWSCVPASNLWKLPSNQPPFWTSTSHELSHNLR